MRAQIVLVLVMVVMSGCYRPSWHRENTTYAVLKADSEWCKTQINIGATRSEMIEQYEKCMRNKGYQLKDQAEARVEQPPAKSTEEKDRILFDQHTKVYVSFAPPSSASFSGFPAYRYFHKKDCKHLSDISIKEVTVAQATSEGKSKCPDCFR